VIVPVFTDAQPPSIPTPVTPIDPLQGDWARVPTWEAPPTTESSDIASPEPFAEPEVAEPDERSEHEARDGGRQPVDAPADAQPDAVGFALPDPQPDAADLAAAESQRHASSHVRPDPFDDEEDVEATRIVSQRRAGERFILQFSTGESFTVYGTGLIGRNPRPEPAEYFDQLIRVVDPSRSVSKTHLEFGQESGAFWIKDRYSGNGTIVREPDVAPVRCLQEKRYRLVRGTRVDIGEQFFVVS
jgi:hypothetical protein